MKKLVHNNVSVPVQNEMNYTQEEKIRAVYALNMCTVSVSQIVKYKDSYILDQEYDAILNNLNLEAMPKDEALLNILRELLNTITAFKIQEIKKQQIEKEYQKRVKTAIWSAIPTPSILATGNPVAIITSLATQVGTGYMNYRREKANALSDKEKEEVELYIVALEQFNALRRELFTTAWRLADRYEFPDALRLTERQIDQYNEILMDQDEYRKYARLEAVQAKFKAYPPFWYFFAHTALHIAANEKDRIVQKQYIENALEHFKAYRDINTHNILREDQLTSSANLEYVDLLLSLGCEEKNKIEEYRKNIKELIDEAKEKAGNANDVLQLCAVAYLRNDNKPEAADILKYLVNEDYNAVSNAKILSKIYAKKCIGSSEKTMIDEAWSDYQILAKRVDGAFLYPLNQSIIDSKPEEIELEQKFVENQKEILKRAYRLSLDCFQKKCARKFNAVIPAPKEVTDDYYDNSTSAENKRLAYVNEALSREKSKQHFIEQLRDCGLIYGYIDVLNQTIVALETIPLFRMIDKHDEEISYIKARLKEAKAPISEAVEKINSGYDYSFEEYQGLVSKYSFNFFTGTLFDDVKRKIQTLIDDLGDYSNLECIENDLAQFCEMEQLPELTSYMRTYNGNTDTVLYCKKTIFDFSLLGGEEGINNIDEEKAKVLSAIKQTLSSCIVAEGTARILFYNEDAFATYFKNNELENGNRYIIKQNTVAIIDDQSKQDCDLLLGINGLTTITKNKISAPTPFNDVEYIVKGRHSILKIGSKTDYKNDNIDIGKLKDICDRLSILL